MTIEVESRREFLQATGNAMAGWVLTAAAGLSPQVRGQGMASTPVSSSPPMARTALGSLRGAWMDGIAAFRGVPFAAAPVGARRFAAPALAQAWRGVRDATQDGPICPQTVSRLAAVMGDISSPQGEDCLTLTICTPAPDQAARPVMVWIHGGGYSSGAGSLPWYFGAKLAREGDIVVVGVNYRLGALGYFYWPEVSPGNLGLLDQHAALLWVREHIGAFGGDPNRITLAGQSGGAMDIINLLAAPSARGLFQRGLLQSGALSLPPPPAEEARRIGGLFIQELGIDPTVADIGQRLRGESADRILAAQLRVAQAESRVGNVSPPFRPVADGQFLPATLASGYPEKVAGQIDLMLGTTREEAAALLSVNKKMQSIDLVMVKHVLADNFSDPEAAAAVYLDLRPGATPAMLLGDAQTDQIFVFPNTRLAEAQAQSGRKAYMFQFDWQSPRAGLGACHCLELPFVFGTFEAFSQAPMLAGGDKSMMEALSVAMRRAWIGFVREGNPNHDGLPPWQPYEPERRITMRFDTVCGPVGDLSGYGWRSPAMPALRLKGER